MTISLRARLAFFSFVVLTVIAGYIVQAAPASALGMCGTSATAANRTKCGARGTCTIHDHPWYPSPAKGDPGVFVHHRDDLSCPQLGTEPWSGGNGGGGGWINYDGDGNDLGTYTTFWGANSGNPACGTYAVQTSFLPAIYGGAVHYVTYPTACAPACSPLNGQSCTSAATNACGMPGTGTYNCSAQCVNVTLPSNTKCPSGTFSVTCAGASGTASDPDFAGPATVRVFRDGIVGTQLSPDVTTNPVPNWSWPMDPALMNGTPHTYHAYVKNVNSSGAQEGPWVPIPSPAALSAPLACDAPPTAAITSATCTSASGWAEDTGGAPVPVQLLDGATVLGTANATPFGGRPNFTINYPAFVDGDVHTLQLQARNVPTGTGYASFAPTVTRAVSCEPPAPTDISITQPDYCAVSAPSAVVRWTAEADDDYQLQVATDTNFTSLVYDSKDPLVQAPQPWWKRLLRLVGFGSDAEASTTGIGIIPSSKLEWNTIYFVRVRVRGNAVPFQWSPYSVQTSTTFFSTPIQEFPVPKFSWSPTAVFAGQLIQFTDQSTGAPTSWNWSFGDGSPSDPSQNPTHTYAAEGAYTVILQVTNAAGSCTSAAADGMLNAEKPIPRYREVRPGDSDRTSPTPTR